MRSFLFYGGGGNGGSEKTAVAMAAGISFGAGCWLFLQFRHFHVSLFGKNMNDSVAGSARCAAILAKGLPPPRLLFKVPSAEYRVLSEIPKLLYRC